VNPERRGTLLGVAAYVIWGLFPLYWTRLEPAGAAEILAHRVVWSLVFVALLLAVRRQAFRTLPHDRRRLTLLGVAGALIGVNWGVFIWAVNHGHVVEGSLGYFINPLVTVTLGVVVLGERLRALQWTAVAVAGTGVVVLAVAAGRPPWIALTLAFTFGIYGLVKAVVGVGPVEGLLVETSAIAPIAIVYLLVAGARGDSTFAGHGVGHALMLASTGVVTALPLLAFAAAAATVPLSRLGVLFYLNPTLQLFVGVVVRHEPLGTTRLAGFGLVWVALALFTADTATNRRRQLALTAEASAV
jgi:chloramphenicol-sensitive protein RarD